MSCWCPGHRCCRDKNHRCRLPFVFQYPPTTGGFWKLLNTQKPPVVGGSWFGMSSCDSVFWRLRLDFFPSWEVVPLRQWVKTHSLAQWNTQKDYSTLRNLPEKGLYNEKGPLGLKFWVTALFLVTAVTNAVCSFWGLEVWEHGRTLDAGGTVSTASTLGDQASNCF